MLGYLLAPVAFMIGVPWEDATTVGGLIGTKVVLNEFVAYVQLGEILRGNVAGVTLSEHGTLIATYALCGFANFFDRDPDRRHRRHRPGAPPRPRPLRPARGARRQLATLMTATIAGVLTLLA
jgi:concentrative nucleoside transporter, CNT family